MNVPRRERRTAAAVVAAAHRLQTRATLHTVGTTITVTRTASSIRRHQLREYPREIEVGVAQLRRRRVRRVHRWPMIGAGLCGLVPAQPKSGVWREEGQEGRIVRDGDQITGKVSRGCGQSVVWCVRRMWRWWCARRRGAEQSGQTARSSETKPFESWLARSRPAGQGDPPTRRELRRCETRSERTTSTPTHAKNVRAYDAGVPAYELFPRCLRSCEQCSCLGERGRVRSRLLVASIALVSRCRS